MKLKNNASLIALVAVDNTFFSYDTDYKYNVPEGLDIQIGCTVKVPFGRSDSIRNGVVIDISEGNDDKLKSIYSAGNKIISDELVELAKWLKDRCFCTTYDCLKQMLPRKYGDIKSKSERMVRLLIDDETVLSSVTSKQRIVVDLLLDAGMASVNEVCEFCSVGVSVLKTLEKHGIVQIFDREVYRTPYVVNDSEETPENIILSKKQKEAYETYSAMMSEGGGIGLLHGVTGSGKTHVYLKLIDKAIEMNKDVIVLVPEISLTPQAMNIFCRRYANNVAIIHSGLSLGERNDEYKRIERGEANIVVGTRSAVFAPVHNLGLIIMDEEQEQAYKSDRTPKYNAKDVARFRCAYNNALFLMTSATPSVEAYSNAVSGKYKLCTIDERFGHSVLPEVVVVDMKKERRNNNHSSISSVLKSNLIQTIDNGKQAILLINRRGYNTFIACNECGHIITCPNCSISLTYHSYNNRLVCHYCGYSKKLDNTCPECLSKSVRYSGYGTQRIEEEIVSMIPNARILRMDADTTTEKFAHQKILDKFANGEYNILIGTQMVAKGLDFDNVSLVGVVNADSSLYDENYIASERAFDLITQVIGRAGRRSEKGKAIIQTLNPDNEIIAFASNQDYVSFYNNEIMMRKLMIYPPYCDLISVSFSGDDENSVALCAKEFFELLVKYNSENYKDLKFVVLGPTPARISKMNNTFRYRISLKCKNSSKIRELITNIIKDIGKIKKYKGVSLSASINPSDIS